MFRHTFLLVFYNLYEFKKSFDILLILERKT